MRIIIIVISRRKKLLENGMLMSGIGFGSMTGIDTGIVLPTGNVLQ